MMMCMRSVRVVDDLWFDGRHAIPTSPPISHPSIVDVPLQDSIALHLLHAFVAPFSELSALSSLSLRGKGMVGNMWIFWGFFLGKSVSQLGCCGNEKPQFFRVIRYGIQVEHETNYGARNGTKRVIYAFEVCLRFYSTGVNIKSTRQFRISA